MTCCAKLITIYKMNIWDIWSNSKSSKKTMEPVRYNFERVEFFNLTDVLSYSHFSDWMDTLHFYGWTSQAKSVMQDAEKAHSGKKVKVANWHKELSQVVFHYGQQPNMVLFSLEHASIDNENENNEDDADGTDDEV